LKLNQMRIGPRLALGFGLIVGLLIVVAALLLQRLNAIDADSRRLLSLEARASLADSWRAEVYLNVSRALGIAKAGSGALDAFYAPQMKATSERISQLQKQLSELVDSDKGKALMATIAQQRETYVRSRAEVLALLKEGKADAAQTLLTSSMLPASEAYVGSIDTLARYQRERVKAGTESLDAKVRQASLTLLLAAAVAVVLAGAFAFGITRSVTLPLRRVIAVTQGIAAGNLAQQVVVEGRDEVADMQRSLQQMQHGLAHLVGDVAQGSESIGSASSQIATGTQDLSGRTEQTAGSLQQAASSLEQLTGTVGQTAESARTANQLAAAASQAAQRGGEVVAQVVSTMSDINASSRRISDIIATIDGIAFQTNILALNAAVEAARAGEQGRGFAVVASEVRSLAQRSAAAAREIKSLIQASVERVEAGTRQVQDAGTAMDDIVGGVRRVTDVIGEISAAATEQSSGLRQINETVAGLDQMTQQNAALVEQSSAAAESLREQATRLGQLVATFKLQAA